ncbi:hypothetical protein [Kineosporia babensis]|uniref:Oxidoreductase DRL-like catalytic domain-containing protein n=1 Tax=Kineosporia babensis TaxID=499548 RepID=A0A9X1SYW8_9ACTN|nr:hypothetical protein [Kineosporia babensis]MCD5311413.1 hypothetical protein [Kineosporia babensis]
MNLGLLLSQHGPATVRYALSGAGGGFGRTLLAQTLLIDALRPTLLCDVDPEKVRDLCLELGYPADDLVICRTAEELAATGKVAIVPDAALLDPERYDILVEGTGSPAHGYRMARAALRAGKDVAMVSKEVDSVTGVALARLAAENDAVYTPADGDQPANLLNLISWIRTLGLEIVAVGKSGEYDVVLDGQEIRYLDTTVPAGELPELMTMGASVAETLARRAQTVKSLKLRAAADPCEMSVVTTHGGFVADVESLHYPLARISELADIYALREDGGILSRPGVVDVFTVLRRPDEASFAGGVFAVVRTGDAETWKLLEGKGHVVSQDGKYACLYLPYHVMGVETAISLLTAVRLRVPSGVLNPRQNAVMAGRARADLPAGTVLKMGGHHHEIDGVEPVLLPVEEAGAQTAPFYLAAHTTLARDVRAGELITFADLADPDADLVEAYNAGLGA